MILPGTGRGTAPEGRGGGGSSLRKPEVYAARKLRKSMSLPEAMLWQRLRGNALGMKVRRQHPIGAYVVDFFIRDRNLVIEVDGEAHNRGARPERDVARDAYLKQNGYVLLRIAAVDILKNLDAVLDGLCQMANPHHHHPADGPPPRAGEDC